MASRVNDVSSAVEPQIRMPISRRSSDGASPGKSTATPCTLGCRTPAGVLSQSAQHGDQTRVNTNRAPAPRRVCVGGFPAARPGTPERFTIC